jgi:hypothetical protein
MQATELEAEDFHGLFFSSGYFKCQIANFKFYLCYLNFEISSRLVEEGRLAPGLDMKFT